MCVTLISERKKTCDRRQVIIHAIWNKNKGTDNSDNRALHPVNYMRKKKKSIAEIFLYDSISSIFTMDGKIG